MSGPYFDDLEVGQVFDAAPSMTLSQAPRRAHQAIIGDRLRLALDAELAYAVTGATSAFGASRAGLRCGDRTETLATQRVKANLFYRGLVFHRFPVIGDSCSPAPK